MNLYDSLDLDKSADQAAVKRAYRRKAKKAHPDAGGSAEAFADLTRAYLVLSDPIKRSRYDHDGTIDDSPTQDPLADAKQLVAQFFLNVVTGAEANRADLFAIDLIQACRDALNNDIKQMRAQQAKFKAQQALWEKLSARTRHKDPESFVHRALKHHAQGCARNVEEGDRQVRMREQALDLLKDYSFERDPPKAQAWDSTSTAGTSTVWNILTP